MTAQKVLIAGGGIGGLGAALAVGRRGFDVTVLERAPEFVEIGAGLQLAPNATRVLKGLGVLDSVLDVGVLPDRLVLASAVSGDELTSLDLRGFDELYGGPYVVIHRSDLLSILHQACLGEPNIELRPGQSVVEVDPQGGPGGGAGVRCADGSEHFADALVGADGLHSTVRKLVDSGEPVFSGYVAYRGALPLEQVAAPTTTNDVVAFIGPGLHFVQYPLRRHTLYNQVAVFRSQRWLDGREDWGTPDELDESFAPASEHVRTALSSIQRTARWPMFDREPLDNWRAGRSVLLGDAAHPMLQYLAQGACQALQDGAALARSLAVARDSGSDVEWALDAYQQQRIGPTAKVQRKARLWGDLWHADGLLESLRDVYLRDRDPADQRFVAPIYSPPPAAEASRVTRNLAGSAGNR
ncbi:MAG TPA: FAD-dependent monooxygenase [Trebonia sp.]|nr:FAD-dependent monooxygenase [Trebonia sp.]